jgi:hypothetical protein
VDPSSAQDEPLEGALGTREQFSRRKDDSIGGRRCPSANQSSSWSIRHLGHSPPQRCQHQVLLPCDMPACLVLPPQETNKPQRQVHRSPPQGARRPSMCRHPLPRSCRPKGRAAAADPGALLPVLGAAGCAGAGAGEHRQAANGHQAAAAEHAVPPQLPPPGAGAPPVRPALPRLLEAAHRTAARPVCHSCN